MNLPKELSGAYGEVIEFPEFVYHQDDPSTTLLLNDYGFTVPSTANMEPFALPPSPPASTSHKSRYPKYERGLSYLLARYRGDPLLTLPQFMRLRIFSLLLADFPELAYIEVPETKDLTYPPFAGFSDLWYTETCPMIIKNATFSISSDAAIFSLMVFLNEFEKHESYDNVMRLEFSSLGMFERGVFSANSTKLLRRCENVREIAVMVDLNDLVWTEERGGKELDVEEMSKRYDLKALAHMTDLDVVKFDLMPFMALQKKLVVMEMERKALEMEGCQLPGLDSFWGLKEWLEFQALDVIRLIEVKCPAMVLSSQSGNSDVAMKGT